jgi:hypothetical protein
VKKTKALASDGLKGLMNTVKDADLQGRLKRTQGYIDFQSKSPAIGSARRGQDKSSTGLKPGLEKDFPALGKGADAGKLRMLDVRELRAVARWKNAALKTQLTRLFDTCFGLRDAANFSG